MMIPFDSCHIGLMDLHEREIPVLADRANVEKLSALAAIGLCETVFTDDGRKVLGVVAAIPISQDTCEVLVVSSNEQKKYPVVFAKSVRAALSIIRQHFVNIQTVGEDTSFFARWLSWLGFACRGPVVRPGFGGKRMLMWGMSV